MADATQFITILETEPNAETATEVAIDKECRITFSENIHEDALTNTNFKLFTEPEYTQALVDIRYGQVNGVEHKNIVVVKARENLLREQNYMLVIYGDIALQAGRPIGVVSATGKVLDGNQVIYFTTGKTTEDRTDQQVDAVVIDTYVDVNPDPVVVDDNIITDPVVITDPNVINQVVGYDDDTGTLTGPPLRVKYTFPENGEINISDFSEMEIVFNDTINWEEFGIYIVDETGKTEEEIIAEWDIVRKNIRKLFVIERHDLPFDCNAEMSIRENNSYAGTMIITQLDANAIVLSVANSPFANIQAPNSEYKITVRGGRLHGINTTPIEKTEIRFLTQLAPSYASIDQLDARLPTQFDNMSDYDKYRLIAEYTELIFMRYGGILTGAELCYQANRFIICAILNDLLMTQRDSLGGIKQREQFGLNIVYNTLALGAKQYGPYDQCVAESLIGLDALAGVNVVIGIKSGNTKWYMGRRRGVRTIYELERSQTLPRITSEDYISNNYEFKNT